MREINNKKYFTLLILITVSTLMFSALGFYWNFRYYHDNDLSPLTTPSLATAMRGIHDGLYVTDLSGFHSDYAVDNLSVIPVSWESGQPADSPAQPPVTGILSELYAAESQPAVQEEPEVYDFTTATDDYFADACFIGDSRTVGISQYSGIENATFLCKTSLSIYDYEKPKITYEDAKTSIHDVLSEKQFAKIYLMVGINECGTGTPESFYERYRDVVMDIRRLQPEALIFIQGNLFVTQKKSEDGDSITNENIAARNNLIATLANQKDIFYIDINESSLCDEGALISDYTWDQVHVKAQYYPIWKDFLLRHAIYTDSALTAANRAGR
ncbi:MAG: hypothetical protein HFH75_00525 [Lachnospiraceae bacterium]|jgi:hypothetical protein|nr:hypothetical protein [Lachnospiraceae bacterium]MDE7001938.1 hypothetical protein [Lachnospiraceae bacterium]